MMITLVDAASIIEKFADGSLTARIADLEKQYSLTGIDREKSGVLSHSLGVNQDLLTSALVMKQLAGQINVIVHTVGILLLLPHILSEGEIVESLSLGAGNTGRSFDLETNLRIAEFKFIHWRGGAEAIRQNSIFKDFYGLAEATTTKERYLYVIGDHYPLRFFGGRRSLKSVLSRDRFLSDNFYKNYADRFSIVSEYYMHHKDSVHIVDVTQFMPAFAMLFKTQDSDNI
jgi:hypothetical protein